MKSSLVASGYWVAGLAMIVAGGILFAMAVLPLGLLGVLGGVFLVLFGVFRRSPRTEP